MGRKYDSITPVFKELHWLPVEFRIKFKILLQVHKSLNGMAPKYLSDKLTLKPNIGLRSDNSRKLRIPDSRLKSYGDRAFSVAGPTLWNDLPKELRLCEKSEIFKRDLKTHLFKEAFGS